MLQEHHDEFEDYILRGNISQMFVESISYNKQLNLEKRQVEEIGYTNNPLCACRLSESGVEYWLGKFKETGCEDFTVLKCHIKLDLTIERNKDVAGIS